MQCVRNDYAINGGLREAVYFASGPDSYEQGDDPSKYSWPDNSGFVGISCRRSDVRVAQVIDGTSNTYLCGEKFLNPDFYENGKDAGDNQSCYTGDSRDVVRFADMNDLGPNPDTPGLNDTWNFGGPHPGVFIMAMCDGSVDMLSFDISREVYVRGIHRTDEGGSLDDLVYDLD